MADLKISQLPAATVPLAGTEVLPIVQSGTTVQVSVTNAIASRASLGANTFTAAQEWATGTAIASAATINLDTATGNRVHITGTTAITAVTLTRGPRTLVFDGVLTLTHNATTNNLPGGVNITTAAGDRAIYESDGTTVYCVSYNRASGLPVVAGASAALVLLSTVNAAGSATVDIETTFNSTYDNYMIVASGITCATSGAFNMRFKIGASYFSSGLYDYHVTNLVDSSASYAASAAEAATSIAVLTSLDSTANSTAGFVMYVYKPAATNILKQVSWTGAIMRQNASSSAYSNMGAGGVGDSQIGALTGVRFLMASGNINAGAFRLYGIANS
jgi:hypothetical protein